MSQLFSQYADMTDQDVAAAIWRAKVKLGKRLTILGHHYQRDEVIQFADYRGDSLGLSQRAAQAKDAEYIVFCGVYFMAETAAILAKPHQQVIQPAIEALCPMARLANATDAMQAWEALSRLYDGDLLPITYQNSIAELKAFVGQHGGVVCTSSNAQQLYKWAFRHKGHILFMPDEHLGTNTALALGIPLSRVATWDPAQPPELASLADAQVVAWRGYCYVHEGFTEQDVQRARQAHPNALIVVHPECPHRVVTQADASGSTTGILDFVANAPAGATIYVGTEWNLVNRLAHAYNDRTILPLAQRTCRTMSMTTMRHLLAALESILEGTPQNIVLVDAETAKWSRVALERMLEQS